jgi:hypothetical protein
MSDAHAMELFQRVPGLYRAWDLGLLIEPGHSYRIEDAGRTADGQPLFMVFHAQLTGDAVRHLS